MGLFKLIALDDASLFFWIFCYVLRSVKTICIKARQCIAEVGGRAPITAGVMLKGPQVFCFSMFHYLEGMYFYVGARMVRG